MLLWTEARDIRHQLHRAREPVQDPFATQSAAGRCRGVSRLAAVDAAWPAAIMLKRYKHKGRTLMKQQRSRIPTLLACGICLPTAALADAPAFDCAQARDTVEQRICGDAALAALDRKLDAVYKAAAGQAEGPLASQLRAEQRGWIKGRNECWKADGIETWITATWTVNTVDACIAAQYRLRTSELQALWRLVPPRTIRYGCQGNRANTVVANFFATDPPTLRLERGDRTVTLWRVGPAEAGKYEGQNVAVEITGQQLKFDWLNTATGNSDVQQCAAE